MSYSIHLFHPKMKVLAQQGNKVDEIERPAIDAEAMEAFLQRLAQYGYSAAQKTPYGIAFIKRVDSCVIEVLVSSSEISFSVPYSGNASEAIFMALQDASELTDRGDLILFNPQDGTWL